MKLEEFPFLFLLFRPTEILQLAQLSMKAGNRSRRETCTVSSLFVSDLFLTQRLLSNLRLPEVAAPSQEMVISHQHRPQHHNMSFLQLRLNKHVNLGALLLLDDTG